MSTYSEKLKDPRWQKKRLEVLNRDGWECTNCCRTDVTLHVHHEYYVSGREPWDYPTECLTTLCKDCHQCIDDCDDKAGLMVTVEFLLHGLLRLAPEGHRAELALSEIALPINEAGMEWRTNNRRRLTEKEWYGLWDEVTELLESKFAQGPDKSEAEQ